MGITRSVSLGFNSKRGSQNLIPNYPPGQEKNAILDLINKQRENNTKRAQRNKSFFLCSSSTAQVAEPQLETRSHRTHGSLISNLVRIKHGNKGESRSTRLTDNDSCMKGDAFVKLTGSRNKNQSQSLTPGVEDCSTILSFVQNPHPSTSGKIKYETNHTQRASNTNSGGAAFATFIESRAQQPLPGLGSPASTKHPMMNRQPREIGLGPRSKTETYISMFSNKQCPVNNARSVVAMQKMPPLPIKSTHSTREDPGLCVNNVGGNLMKEYSFSAKDLTDPKAGGQESLKDTKNCVLMGKDHHYRSPMEINQLETIERLRRELVATKLQLKRAKRKLVLVAIRGEEAGMRPFEKGELDDILDKEQGVRRRMRELNM